jgi:hypothetical protein
MNRYLPRMGIRGTDPPVNTYMLVSHDKVKDLAHLEVFEERGPD